MKYVQIFTRNRRFVIPALLICTLVAGYFGIRGIILQKAIASVNYKLGKYDYSSHWDGARFKGLNRVFARSIYVQSKNGNKEVQIDSLLVGVRLLPLITGNVRIRNLDGRQLRIRWTSGDSAVIPDRHQTDTSRLFDELKERDLAEFAYQQIRRFMNFVPKKVSFDRIEARYTYTGKTTAIALHDSKLNKGSFTSRLTLGDTENEARMPVFGKFDRSKSIVELHVSRMDTGMLPMPFLRDRFSVAAGFDSLDFLIDLGHRNRHLVRIDGQVNLVGLIINSERLSTGNIVINRFRSDYRMHIGPHHVEIDSSSLVFLNNAHFNPFLKFSLNNSPALAIKILPQNWIADDLFSSLPEGMFTSLTGTRAKGSLDFSMDFYVNLDEPDSLRFNIDLKGNDFDIISFGSDDYRVLNGSFVHRVYQRGNLVASFPVGTANSDYVSFEDISPLLRAAVMTSEDGSFFYHNGFNPGAFRESIATNIKEQRFARGGSTISMQLVKNVFLTRNKTIARKIEEALIVWLIENLNLVSKQRMYEVYLNIIEWGPGIYGIGQASRYYFDKKPSELSLQESIFLASIVPRPKWFKYTFEANGRPKSFFAAYFNRLKELMVRKEFISSSDTTGIIPIVTLTGPATQVFDTAFYRGSEPVIPPLEPLTIRKIEELKHEQSNIEH